MDVLFTVEEELQRRREGCSTININTVYLAKLEFKGEKKELELKQDADRG